MPSYANRSKSCEVREDGLIYSLAGDHTLTSTDTGPTKQTGLNCFHPEQVQWMPWQMYKEKDNRLWIFEVLVIRIVQGNWNVGSVYMLSIFCGDHLVFSQLLQRTFLSWLTLWWKYKAELIPFASGRSPSATGEIIKAFSRRENQTDSSNLEHLCTHFVCQKASQSPNCNPETLHSQIEIFHSTG